MLRLSKLRAAFSANLVSVAILCAQMSAHAHDSDPYDVDSLVYLSETVAEVKVGKANPDEKAKSRECAVVKIHKGGLKDGQAIAIGKLDSYKDKSKELAEGSQIFAFLSKEKTVVPSGVKLVVEDSICGFVKVSKMEYMMREPRFEDEELNEFEAIHKEGGKKLPTVVEFRRTIADSIERTNKWKALFAAEENAKDTPWLLALIKERRQTGDGVRDHILV